QFLRGLPGAISIDAVAFLGALDQLLDIAPALVFVALEDAGPATLEGLADHPWPARLKGLYLHGRSDPDSPTQRWDEAVARLVASPNCPELEELHFELCDIDPAS